LSLQAIGVEAGILTRPRPWGGIDINGSIGFALAFFSIIVVF